MLNGLRSSVYRGGKRADSNLDVNNNKNPLEQQNLISSYDAIKALFASWHDGTFREIVADWRWIFTYSARHKGAIAFYVVLGLISTTMGLIGTVVSKYLIDIITGYQTDKFPILLGVYIGSTVFSLVVGSLCEPLYPEAQYRYQQCDPG